MRQDEYDVVVIGGGPAGLQATLTLGRVHRSVLLLDSGSYRNDPTPVVHNVITRDGTPPAELRALARGELAAYPTVTVRAAVVTTVAPSGDGFDVTLDDCTRVLARRVVLATGVRDTLPEVPGLAALFGGAVAHCPFCHGHEYADGPVAVLGDGPHASRLALMVLPIASRVSVYTDGGALDAATVGVLGAAGIVVRDDAVRGLEPAGSGVRVSFADGSAEELAGMFVSSAVSQAAPFAEQLGLALLPSGGIEVDVMGRTSVPGVYAAGDLAHVAALPMAMQSVVAATLAGQVAGAACVGDQLAADHAMPVPA